MADVTDATFKTEVIDRSFEVPVVVDLWAEWCGPCKQLGPILEKVVGETNGAVELAKVDVDSNPQIGQMFKVQSIPAVFAVSGGQVVAQFVGAQPEAEIRRFVEALGPAKSPADILTEIGDEASLRQALELEPGHIGATVVLAKLLVDAGNPDAALELLAKVPETAEVSHVAALARMAQSGIDPGIDVDAQLSTLLDKVKDDEDAKREFLDLLQVLGPDDPRTAPWRKKLTARLF